MFRRLKLFPKIMIGIIIAVETVFIISTIIRNNNYYSLQQDYLIRIEESRTKAIEIAIEREFVDLHEDVSELKRDLAQNTETKDKDQDLKDFLFKNEFISKISILDQQGAEIGSFTRESGIQTRIVTPIIPSALREYDIEKYIGKLTGIDSNKSYFSYERFSNSDLQFLLFAPIQDGNTITGFLLLQLYGLKFVAPVLTNSKVYNDEVINIVDSKTSINLTAEINGNEAIVAVPAKNFGSYINANNFNSHYLIDIEEVRSDASLHVFRTIPVATVFEPANQGVQNNFIISLITGWAAIFFVLIFARLFFKPVNDLNVLIEQLTQGKFEELDKISSDDEIGDIAANLKKITALIIKSNNELEAKIQEKTKQIEENMKSMEQNNQTLEQTKLAMLNLFEDLETSKDIIEQEKVRDEAYLENIGEALIVLDKNGHIKVMNKSAEQMFGYSITEVAGKRIDEVMKLIGKDEKGNYKTVFEIPILKVLQTGKEQKGEYYYKRKDGSSFPGYEIATPVILNKKIIGAIKSIRDITQEKEVDRAKSEFVSIASHQLRSPLTSIGWYIEMLLSGETGEIPEKQKIYLAEIQRAHLRMVELVNSLLNVSRIDMGNFAITPRPTNLNKLVEEVISAEAVMITTKKLQVSKNLSGEVPELQADPKVIKILLENLVSNAVKYTPENGSVYIETYFVNGEKPEWGFKVSDTGYGIPKDNQDKIFGKMYRADNVKAMDTDGTGLGLFIVKSIVDNLEGKLWFESEENKGSTFFIQIPLDAMTKEHKGKI